MYVKRIVDKKILDVLHLAWDVYEEEVAPYCSEEGVECFRNFIKFEHMISMIDSRAITFFKAVEGEELCGMSAIGPDGHILLFGVKNQWRGKGAEDKLFNAMKQYCIIERRIMQMTVDATPNMVSIYQQLGFKITRPEQEKDGLRVVSMLFYIKDGKAIAGGLVPKKRNNTGQIVCVLFMIGLLCFNLFGAKNLVSLFQDEPQSENGSVQIPENGETADDSELQGMDAIEVVIEEELPFEITEESYVQYSDKASGKYQMDFEVKYPQIKGIGLVNANKINQTLKECAMSTVDTLYLTPSEGVKEAMLKLKDPVLTSHVTYKITYASEDYISVVFEDQYIAGDSQKKYVDLRARTIDISTGEIYEMKDIVDLSDDFMTEWRKRMLKENPSSTALREMKVSECRKILQGQTLGGNYHEVFFIDKNGLQIGITYHFSNDMIMENGWTTAAFTADEIKQYQVEE